MNVKDPKSKQRDLDRQARGECIRCRKPLVTTHECEACRRKTNAATLAAYRRRNPVRKKVAPFCPKCGKRGHFQKTCKAVRA